jgi:cytochrome c
MTNQNATTKKESLPTPFSGLRYLLLLVPLFALYLSPKSSSGSPAEGVANPLPGKVIFEKRCAGCHSFDQDREGPRLRNIYGAKAASTPTFKYSAALKSSQIIWNDESLDKWLTDPDSLVPDTDMDFRVPKADERADVIRYLRVASGKQ